MAEPTNERKPRAITPEEEEGELRVGEPSEKAGGWPAVGQALRHVWGKSGVLRGSRALGKLNQFDGFDCPSCAWPDPDGERAAAEFCENGAKAVASEAMAKKIEASFFNRYTVDELAGKSDHWLDQQGRLCEPMVLREGDRFYQPISWEEAIGKIASQLRGLSSPDRAAFYTSGRASNEAAFMYQLLARKFGTNNLPDCSNMCHESSGVALKASIGVGKGTVKLEDFGKAELILIIGQNPGTNHPRMLSALREAKIKGAKIVSINPLREAGLVAFSHPQKAKDLLGGKTPLADHFTRVAINGDQALLQGVGKRLLELAALDEDFRTRHTAGFEAYRSQLQETSWEEIERLSGVSKAEICQLAELVGRHRRIITCWAMGLTQHRNAVATIREIANVHLLRGAVGQPGAGLCPVRGHSNVQGDRTMGIYEAMPEPFLARLSEVCGFEAPRRPGYHTVSAIQAMAEGKVDVFFALGGNFVSASPDTERTAEALARCQLTAQVSTKLNRSHLATGREALILPCLGRTERDEQAAGSQWVSVENSMGIVHSSQGRLRPASDLLLSEPAIVCRLGRELFGEEDPVDWSACEADYREIRRLIEQVVPGFEDYERRARQPGGFYLPNAARECRFETDTGKANFAACPLDVEVAPEGKLLLMTIRSHDQFNTTVYGLDDRYRGVKNGRRVVFMNEEDMASRDLRADQVVDVQSHFKGETRRSSRYRLVPYDIPRGCVAMYFPESNALVPLGHTAKESHTPASKSVVVEVLADGAGL